MTAPSQAVGIGPFFAVGHALKQCDATTGHAVQTVAFCQDAALAQCLSEMIAERDALTARVRELEAALNLISDGPPSTLENCEVAAWAAHIARAALAKATP